MLEVGCWSLCSRTGISICTQKAQTHNFEKKIENSNFFSNSRKQKWHECAIWVHVWGGRSGMLKPYPWWIFWAKNFFLKFWEKKNQAKFLKACPPLFLGGGECQDHPNLKIQFLWIERSDGGRSWCVRKVWGFGVRLGHLERFSSACTHQARVWKFLLKNGQNRGARSTDVPAGCNTLSERADPKNVSSC